MISKYGNAQVRFNLPGDIRILFAARSLRLFAYGFLSVVLVLYLATLRFDTLQIGLLLTLTLLGDTLISLGITTRADRFGRRRMLVLGAMLMILAGVLFAGTDNFILLLVAAIVGVLSPSGNEVGPFSSIEQAALSQLVPDRRRTSLLAWYVLVGSVATAFGALSAGILAQSLQLNGIAPLSSYRIVLLVYAGIGAGLGLLFARLSPAVEAPVEAKGSHPRAALAAQLGLTRSYPLVKKFAALFALDAFAGAFVLQSFVAYWFHLRYGVEPALLGSIFFAANLLAGISAVIAARLAGRFGLVNTMVFTHLPSNVLLLLVPLMPNVSLAILALLVRFLLSQMDVPTRESYTMAIVPPEERSAAAGVTGAARTTGAAFAPLLAGLLLGTPALFGAPFVVAGGIKIVYDVLLYRNFRGIKPPEEK